MKILLLEDDVILQEIMEEFLVEKGYEVESFFDEEQVGDLANLYDDFFGIFALVSGGVDKD